MILMHSNSIGCTEHCWRGNDAACGHSFKLTGIKSPKVQQSISTYLIISLHVWKARQLSTVSSCSSVDISSVTLWTWAEHEQCRPQTVLIGKRIPQSEIVRRPSKKCPNGLVHQWALVATQLPSIGVLIWGWRHLTLLRKVVSLISSVQELHMLWISLNIFTPGLRDLEGEKHTNNVH
jgi:hypothetical protein